MIIIGEKINGAIPSVAKAIAARDEAYITELAKKQADAGADYIDVCASVKDNESEVLRWLIGLVQQATDTPISIDSPDAGLLAESIKFCGRPGLINSVSCERGKIEKVFPVIADSNWRVMALLCDDNGIPKTPEKRLCVLEKIMASAAEYGIAEDRIFIDPLVEMLCTSENGALTALNVIGVVRANFPKLHISCAVSNISYNLPYRKIVNIAYTVMAAAAGMDCAVLDPLNRDLIGAVYAANALMGDDFCCLSYISAFRDGKFGSAS